MFDNFSEQSKEAISLIDKYKRKYNIMQAGTELLLLALLNLEDSICKFILREYNNEVLEKMEDIISTSVFLRKDDEQYTKKMLEIFENAYSVGEDNEINNEHLFYLLIVTPNTVALNILIQLGYDIDNLLDDLNNIYEFEDEPDNMLLLNLTKQARNGKLNPFIGRDELVQKIVRILSKKQKNNPMLIGGAGVGKSALVDGLALHFLTVFPHMNIYRLDLGMVIAGTKYRGDLEDRLLKILDSVKNPNSIIFIDEIHNILGTGSSEGTLDIANILKPILSRNEIKCIGATTIDEYYSHIAKDKALTRRFQNVFIDEPSKEETVTILEGIKYTYEDFYNISYSKEAIEYIVEMSSILKNKKFPDKAIDILDEVGFITKENNYSDIALDDVDKVAFEYLGINLERSLKAVHNIKHFPKLKKYYLNYLLNINLRKTLLNLQTQNVDAIELLIEDLKDVFGIKDEMLLNIDLKLYQDSHYSSSLIGAPAGYVGYENGGILTEHVLKYPISIVIIKNFDNTSIYIKTLIEEILKEGKIVDSKGRTIYYNNTIFIFEAPEKTNKIGFVNDADIKRYLSDYIDDEINGIKSSMKKDIELERIIKKLERNNIKVGNKEKVLDRIYNLEIFK